MIYIKLILLYLLMYLEFEENELLLNENNFNTFKYYLSEILNDI